MCGIGGIASQGWERQQEKDLYKMCNTITHRGPDDSGLRFWVDHGVGLCHRRLSIIDLTTAGRNPMSNEDGSVWIVFNGEVYNFRELREELEQLGHAFRSQSDTEVIIHAYEEWGDNHVHRLRGMFAYAIYDRRGQSSGASLSRAPYRILLVRDRLGIKPLFYYWDGKRFVFASEIKSILSCSFVNRAIDYSALFDYLTYFYVPAPKTAYSFIQKLPPAHMLIFDGDKYRVSEYWDVSLEEDCSIKNSTEAVEIVQEALRESVRLHMISDVPVGVFLSGGMDSSTVTALMASLTNEPIRSFSIGFDRGFSETTYARLVAKRYNTMHVERIVGAESVPALLSLILELYDEPFADSSAIPTYIVSKLAREYVKVVLSGDGGDEVFSGYKWYARWQRRRWIDVLPLRRRLISKLANAWPDAWRGKELLRDLASTSLGRYARLLELFSPAEKRRMISPEWRRSFSDYDDYWYFRQYWRADIDWRTRIQYLDLKTYLPDDILVKVDRASMAVSLEARPPLLDHVLVERMFSIPAKLRSSKVGEKPLLKLATRHLLPTEILQRDKKGFSVPSQWMRVNREWILDFMEGAPSIPFLQSNITKEFWHSRNASAKMWALLVLQGWWANEVQ